MEPISPVLTEEFVPNEVVFSGKDCNDLPVLMAPGIAASRWRLSDADRKLIAMGADVMLQVWLGSDKTMQPVRVEVIEAERDLMKLAADLNLI